ncbi:hypothetical protein ANANG_G00253560 [Anguilla anguilla]|uniref:Uncharacterized protein n=1 Tax=Anguilla anguilla TaxID=7936 RepID=A0A9D3LSQ9_ANGAN|nr:hypothetical protein ANANG_G00253560 [Anguilla anguilla]
MSHSKSKPRALGQGERSFCELNQTRSGQSALPAPCCAVPSEERRKTQRERVG